MVSAGSTKTQTSKQPEPTVQGDKHCREILDSPILYDRMMELVVGQHDTIVWRANEKKDFGVCFWLAA